ncbi:ComF family protein [Thermoactinomyces intermedius]|uniref:ComF family protein n=1 Tax=Thermoactinomyces intermedius TaxID=2024 RepID=A0A8I1ABT1_THEIN|nr:ComF family protein [Thermoactinomyces intermedius]MBA4548187.1 ComF family protein [Thermoactinomyces intermedius]MBA4835249.1 ComF family protein [Thermoactinomyces intermedius]MBH8595031.1 ComF family protein [Thermoactinomyces intermedius]
MKWWSSLFPAFRTCWFCPSPVQGTLPVSVSDHICPVCLEQAEMLQKPFCSICMSPGIFNGEICGDCLRVPPGERVVNRSAVSYSPLVREWIWTLKYGGKESLAVPMGKWMAEVVREHYGRKAVSVITYVPMHGERQKQRGFNQAERLALTIGKKLWIPVRPLLKRVKETTPQSRRTRRERLHSINGVFQLADQRQAEKGRKRSVLIVDDVYTTGATVRECAKVLRNAGFQEVFSVTFAR